MTKSIKESLSLNPELNEGLREDVLELTTIFHNYFQNVDLKNLETRLKTIKIEKSNKYAHRMPFIYNPIKNEAKISVDALEKGDAKHILMQLLLNIITAKDNYYGFNSTSNLEFLNRGMTEIIANNLVGNSSDISYNEGEVVATNIIGIALTEDVLINSYFSNDGEYLTNVANNGGL